jgi:hypothetical protein
MLSDANEAGRSALAAFPNLPRIGLGLQSSALTSRIPTSMACFQKAMTSGDGREEVSALFKVWAVAH